MDVRLQSKITPAIDIGAWRLQYSPDGQILAVNDSKKSRVYLQDVENNQELPSIPKSVGLSPFAFHPRGTLAVPPAAGRVAFHPLRPGQPSFPEITGNGHALNLAFSRAGERLAVAWGDVNLQNDGQGTRLRRVTVHETATGATLWAADLPANTPGGYKVALAMSPDGQSLATVGPSGEARLFSVGKNDEPIVLGKLDGRICAIDFHPDGQSLVAAGIEIGAVWDLKSRAELFRVHSAAGTLWDIAYSPDGQLLAGACDQRAVSLWDSRSGRELATLASECGAFCLSLAFSPRGEGFAVGGASVALFKTEGRKECRHDLAAYTGNLGLAFEKTRKALLSCGDGKVWLWNLNDPAPGVFRKTHREGTFPAVIRLAPDGRQLALGFVKYANAAADGDFSIRVWRLDKPTSERLLKGPKNSVLDVSFDPTGSSLAAASVDGGLYLWDFETGELRHHLNIGQISAIRSAIRFLDDTQLLVAAGNRLMLVTVKDGIVRREVTLPTKVAAFGITPDRKESILVTIDGTIRRVRLPDLVIEQSRKVLGPPFNGTLAVSPDGRILALGTTTEDGVRSLLVDRRTLGPLARLPELGKSLLCMEFDHDGRHLAIGGAFIVLWDLVLVRVQLARIGLDFGEF
jgi:WD40 repeat protein